MILVLTTMSTLTSAAQSENEVDNVYVFGTVKEDSTNAKLIHAEVTVDQDGVEFTSEHVNAEGKYELYLDFDHRYRIRYRAPDHVAKYIEIDTRNIPAEERTGGYGMNVEMTLFKFDPHGDYTFLQEPIGKARFDTVNKELAWDLAWTEHVRERVRVARAKADSLSGLPAVAEEAPDELTENEQWENYGMIAGIVVALIAIGLLVTWAKSRRDRQV
jgi:hypothetical protein